MVSSLFRRKDKELKARIDALVLQKGDVGPSAFDLAQANGFVGTEAEWLASLHGASGLSAYEVAVQYGFEGDEQEWLDALKGSDGQDGSDGVDGQDGTDGKSAYELAVEDGFVGTRTQWLASLKGADGADGTDGQDGVNGTSGTDGSDGLSAYRIAVVNGYSGTETQWLASLKGSDGQDAAINPVPSPATRSVNTNFTPHATRPVLVSYSVEITVTSTLSGGQESTVELRSDTSATPTTVRDSCKFGLSVTLGITVGVASTQRHSLRYLVPAGHNVRLVTSGNGTVSVVGQTEVVL